MRRGGGLPVALPQATATSGLGGGRQKWCGRELCPEQLTLALLLFFAHLYLMVFLQQHIFYAQNNLSKKNFYMLYQLFLGYKKMQ